MEKTILVGSRAFFGQMDGYKSKDVDYVMLTDEPKGFGNVRQTSGGGYCLFEWRKMTAQEFVDYTLRSGGPKMQAGKFLVKEFADEVGFTLEHLKQLESVFDGLDGKHQYEKIIYDAYVANGGYMLTDEQLAAAYESYKAARPGDYKAEEEMRGDGQTGTEESSATEAEGQDSTAETE